eukprot:2327076-Rhodomonas_salina.1
MALQSFLDRDMFGYAMCSASLSSPALASLLLSWIISVFTTTQCTALLCNAPSHALLPSYA